MKKMTSSSIANPERHERRVLRLKADTVRLLRAEALALAVSGCTTTSYTTEAPQGTAGGC
jgi:hypothetical protein